MPVSFHLHKFLGAIPVAMTWKKANKWITNKKQING